MVSMNRLSTYERTEIVKLLVEGMSIRATCRTTGFAKGTVLKLLADLGEVCAGYQTDHIRNLKVRRVQADEIWSFVGSKAKNVPVGREGEYGDAWTWVAMDADTKLVINWAIGGRDARVANEFMDGVAQRLATRVQLTTDGHKSYLDAVAGAFGLAVDYAQLLKQYGAPPAAVEAHRRYSPATCKGVETRVMFGNPDPEHINTSYIERQNLTMRMNMRRFTRLTNGFSKKAENLAYAVALHFQYYNFARPHQTLKGRTPAMAAGLADHVWSVDEIVGLLEAYENQKIDEKSN